jgi:hypothetical protein
VACTMRRMRVASLVFLACVTSCATAPAARSPLREQLAAADTPSLRDAANDCLAKAGWKVDPFPGLSGGADVVRASKAGVATDVYLYSSDVKPRITGGPDDKDPFWVCLGTELKPVKP